MAAQISVIAHRMSASFFAAQSAIETAFASLQSTEAPDTGAVIDAVTRALDSIGRAGKLRPTEAALVAREALRLAENFRNFLDMLNPSEDAELWKLYEQFSEEAEDVALGAEPKLKASADLIRSDIASGHIATYPDWPPPIS